MIRTLLTATFDVTDLSPEERSIFEGAVVAQVDGKDAGYRDAGYVSSVLYLDSEGYVDIRLGREEAEAIAGDLSRAATEAASDTESDEAQGIASDLEAVLRLFERALGREVAA